MNANLHELVNKAQEYANNYPLTSPDSNMTHREVEEARRAIFISHLAYLLNEK